MSGKHITQLQEKIYMKNRQTGCTQELSAAKAGINVRSGASRQNGRRGLSRRHRAAALPRQSTVRTSCADEPRGAGERHGPASSPQNGLGGGVQSPVLRDGQRGDGNPSRVHECQRPQLRAGGL